MPVNDCQIVAGIWIYTTIASGSNGSFRKFVQEVDVVPIHQAALELGILTGGEKVISPKVVYYLLDSAWSELGIVFLEFLDHFLSDKVEGASVEG